MNIIKKVVVFVMGLVVIGVVSTAVGITTQTKNVEKSVTFELLIEENVTKGTYDTLLYYKDYDIISTKLNNNNIDIELEMNVDVFYITDNLTGNQLFLEIGDIYSEDDFGVNVGDTITITFAVEQETPTIIKSLLVLIPLVFTASLIGYLSLSTKKGDE